MASTSVPHRWTYDVFVSFRGEDIRKNFMDHLFKDLKQKGIHAFRDDSELPRGESIASQLYKAIENSRFLIVIFSKNYASSSWSLRELVKILECKQMGNHRHHIQVIFYDVKPDVVRNQTGSYADAFEKHYISNRTEVAKWKKALSMAAGISGWDLQAEANGYESKLIDAISKEILVKLCDGPMHVGEHLVGIDAHADKISPLRFIRSHKVYMIGICGIGGIGKTTLAKVIYNLMYVHFDKCFFCEDVQGTTKRHGLSQVLTQLIDDSMQTRVVKVSNISQGITLWKQSIKSKRILLVVDDIGHLEQLQALAGSRSWFFPGSLIIITSKDKQLLSSHKADEIYEIGFLNDDNALELFSWHAFGEKHPREDFQDLADRVVQYVQGHCLALIVLGNFLYNKTELQWKSELDRLQSYPNAEIQRVLKLSFNGLDIDQQSIFLDISSAFVGESIDLAASVLDSCNLFANTNIRVLVDKSLVTISSSRLLQVHDLIQAMAKEIVREESNRPRDRSRLWIPSDVIEALSKNKVTQAIEVLVLMLQKSFQKVHIDCKSFSSMNNLRILKICDLELEDSEHVFESELAKDSKVNYSGSLEFLSNELRLLYWHRYPFKSLPSDFYPENIAAIDMSYGCIKYLWTTPMRFKRLKIMKLRHCRNLTNSPDFTEIRNLEELNFEGCINLREVHASIGLLKQLVVLNMRNCIRLRSVPCITELYSLEVLNLSGCLKMDKFPKMLGTLKSLVELCVDKTAIKDLVPFQSSLSNVQVDSITEHEGTRLSQSRWWTSTFWPSFLQRKFQHSSSLVLPSLSSLRLLKRLDLSHCNLSELNQDSIGGLLCLKHLNLSGNDFTSLPASLSRLSRLQMLGLAGCKKLEAVPELPPNITHFDAVGCTALRKLHKQQVLNNDYNLFYDFTNCPKLVDNYTIESMVSMLVPQRSNYIGKKLHIVLQGTRIPQWFTNQSTGNHVKVELPPGWLYDKFRGYGTCVVFTAKNLYHSALSHLTCKVRNIYGDVVRRDGVGLGTIFPVETVRIAGSDLIWFHYSESTIGWKNINNFITVAFTSSPDVEVKECGVRLVCEEDIQEGSNLSMFHGLPSPRQGVSFHSSHDRISEIIEDEPPCKRNRIV